MPFSLGRHMLSILTILLISCAESRYDVSAVTRIRIDENTPMSPITTSDLFTNASMVALETKPGSLISEIYKIVEYNNNYFLEDKFAASTLLSFGKNGKFVMQYGHKGIGPGDYTLPMDFGIDPVKSEVLVLNSEEHKLNFYDLASGNFKREKPYLLPFHEFVKTKKGYVVGGAARQRRIIFCDSNLIPTKQLIDYRPVLGMGIFNKFITLDSLTLFRLSLHDTVYSVLEDDIKPYLVVDFGRQAFHDSDYQKISDVQQQRLYEYIADKKTNIAMYAENADSRIFSFDYKRERYICVQDKSSLHFKIFNGKNISDNVFFLTDFPMIVGTDKSGHFLFTVTSSRYLAAKEKMNKAAQGSMYAKLSVSDSISNLSNPILGKFKISKF